MCNKRRYSQLDALSWLWKSSVRQKRGSKKRKECRHYFCDECQAFHVTSKGYYKTPEEISKEYIKVVLGNGS